MSLDDDEKAIVKELQLITAKPGLYIANVDEAGLAGNEYVDRVKALAAKENAVVVVVCAQIEAEIAQLDDADKKDFLDSLGLEEPGLNRVIRSAYDLLGL